MPGLIRTYIGSNRQPKGLRPSPAPRRHLRLTRSWDPRGTGAAGPSSELGTALVALAGILPAGLGAMALAGWYGHDLVLLRVDEGWSPIVYNEALDLALVGLALLALAAGWRRWALPAAVYAIAIGALSCAEAVTGRSLGIDQLFMHAWVAASGHAPGRMAPNAALGSVLAGTALVVASRGPGPRRAAVVGSAGALVLAIGSVGVFGYAAGVPSAYGWGHLTALAFVAAVGLMVVGAGLVGAAWWFLEPGGTRAGWVLAPMAAGVLSLVLVAWSVVVQLTGATPRGSVAATTAGATVVVGLVVGGLASLSLSLFGRLNASEERFRSTFDRSPVGLALASLEPGAWLRFQRVNPALCELTGFDTRALLEMALGDLAGPADTVTGRGDDDHSGTVLGIPAPPAPDVEDSWVRRYVRADGGMFWPG